MNLAYYSKKKRDLKHISSRLKWAKAIRSRLHKDRFIEWFRRSEDIGEYCGTVSGNFEPYIVISCREGGYSTNVIDPENNMADYLKMASREDLPLLIGREMSPSNAQLLEQRLKGTLEPLQHRQDLIDEHVRLDARYRTIHRVIDAYEEFLLRAVMEKYGPVLYSKPGLNSMLVLDIEGEMYYFVRHPEFKLYNGDVIYQKIS